MRKGYRNTLGDRWRSLKERLLRQLGLETQRAAAAVVTSFEKVLSGIRDQLLSSPENAICKMGLVYVCLRNICMAASSKFCDCPDFSDIRRLTIHCHEWLRRSSDNMPSLYSGVTDAQRRGGRPDSL